MGRTTRPLGVDPASFLVSRVFFLSIGVAAAALGSVWAGRRRAIGFSIAGGLIAYAGEISLEGLVPALNIDGMNLVFLLRYPV